MESWRESLKQQQCRKWLQVPPETVTSCKPQNFHVQLMFCFFQERCFVLWVSNLKIYGIFAQISLRFKTMNHFSSKTICKASNLLALHPARKSEKKAHVGIKQHLKLPPRWATCQRRRAVWWPDVAGFIGPSLGLSLAVICRYNAFIKGFFQGWTGEVQGWEGHIIAWQQCSPGCQWQIEEIWTCRFGKVNF